VHPPRIARETMHKGMMPVLRLRAIFSSVFYVEQKALFQGRAHFPKCRKACQWKTG
jgi:hypothetical protein